MGGKRSRRPGVTVKDAGRKKADHLIEEGMWRQMTDPPPGVEGGSRSRPDPRYWWFDPRKGRWVPRGTTGKVRGA